MNKTFTEKEKQSYEMFFPFNHKELGREYTNLWNWIKAHDLRLISEIEGRIPALKDLTTAQEYAKELGGLTPLFMQSIRMSRESLLWVKQTLQDLRKSYDH